jgi:hypothetical protein
MEFLSSNDKQAVLHVLDRIDEAIYTVKIRNRSILSADDYLSTPEGKEKLDAACKSYF